LLEKKNLAALASENRWINNLRFEIIGKDTQTKRLVFWNLYTYR
jgi:hypothetical protein